MNMFLKSSIRCFCVLFFTFLVLLPVFSEQTRAEESAAQRAVQAEERQVPRITPLELRSRMLKGEMILIVDVRSVQSYKAEHITGAISVPLENIESRSSVFPQGLDIVFY
jgi:hypothetical protein